MTEDSDKGENRKILRQASQAGRAFMEFGTYVGAFKKEVRDASNDLWLASNLINEYEGADFAKQDEIKQNLSTLLKVEWVKEPDFEKLYVGSDIYAYGPEKFTVSATEEEEKALEHFSMQIVQPLLRKHKITEKELTNYIDKEELVIKENQRELAKLKGNK